MAEQELKNKVIEVLVNAEFETYNSSENVVAVKQRTTYSPHFSSISYVIILLPDFAKQLADALIAAGLTFDKTAERAFKLYLKYNLECERCVDRMNGVCNVSAEEKADCANRTFSLYKEYAEKESEGKDE